jgi:hypothetical protein
MSALHRIRDILELDGPTFFRIAYRLPAYEGAARVDLEGWLEEMQEQERRLIEAQENEGRPPRYIYDEVDAQRDKESRMNVSASTADRAATLDELRESGPPMPQLGELAPIFEIPIVGD